MADDARELHVALARRCAELVQWSASAAASEPERRDDDGDPDHGPSHKEIYSTPCSGWRYPTASGPLTGCALSRTRKSQGMRPRIPHFCAIEGARDEIQRNLAMNSRPRWFSAFMRLWLLQSRRMLSIVGPP